MSSTQLLSTPDYKPFYSRFTHFGVTYSDLIQIEKESDWLAWGKQLSELAEKYDLAGREALSKDRKVSAKEAWHKASAYFHYAQINLLDSPYKQEIRSRSRQSFSRLAPLLEPEAVRLEIPFETTTIPGYLRIAYPGAPCVILIGGLDSAKEVELYHFAENFLRRGNSVFFFDGPGQGELYGHVSLNDNFERAVSTAINYLNEFSEIDSQRLGLFGVSFGGYLACRAAACEPRIKACISLGGFFDSRVFSHLPPYALDAIKGSLGLSETDDFASVATQITLEPLRGRMDRSLFIVHGSEDTIVDEEQVRAMSEWANGFKKVWIMEGAEHVCTDQFGFCLPEISDWISEQLV